MTCVADALLFLWLLLALQILAEAVGLCLCCCQAGDRAPRSGAVT